MMTMTKFPKFIDERLPPGWNRHLKKKKIKKRAVRWIVTIYSPQGHKFTTMRKLMAFIKENHLDYNPNNFDFNPYVSSKDSSGGGDELDMSSEGLSVESAGELPPGKVSLLISKLTM